METVKNPLAEALLHSTMKEGEKMVVKAEDIEQNSGIDFSKHFFEPEIGGTYLLKFLPNLNGDAIAHRSVYKRLPDPERKGNTFHYISSGSAKTCPVLSLFFELNDLKKNGNAEAAEKIKKYLAKTNQGCCEVQILQSPKKEDIGNIRMFSFATFGPNATVANLLDSKVNPSKTQIEQGFKIEDVFNIFSSNVMSLVCTEASYDGIKGRDFTKSCWVPDQKRGAIGIITDEKTGEVKTHVFVPEDLVNGAIIPEVVPFFEAFSQQLLNPDYDIHTYFEYKEVGDTRVNKETQEYLVNLNKKVEEIIPVIRDYSLPEIANYGKAKAVNAGSEQKPDSAKSIMNESIPDELANSIMNQQADAPKTEVKKETTSSAKNETSEDKSIDDIING
jgi:hypothetical protein